MTLHKLEHHVFICTNERAEGHPRGCCLHKDSMKLLDLLKAEVLKRDLKTTIRVQKAGCLDVCEEGAAIVVYPEGIWYGGVTPGDVAEIVESHLINGVPVERLRIAGK